MLRRDLHGSIWFVIASIPMVVSQIFRLQQSDPAMWVFWDYAGRLCALAILVAIPSMRTAAFRREKLQITILETILWIIGLVLVDHYLGGWVRRTFNAVLPGTVLGTYPHLSGWLYFVDVMFGIALVAYSEEIIFRRCARHVFGAYMSDGYGLVVATSLLFGVYHWWTGIGNIVEATMMGVLLMLFLRRSAALWPVVLSHYLIDIADFA